MTPIERVSEKSRAFAILGVSVGCTKSDIKSAYRQLARAKHPDQGDATSEEFSEITGAYQFLKDHADQLGIAEKPKPGAPRMARPSVRPSETAFSDEIIAECMACCKDDTEALQHVATHLCRAGRSLTYFVPTARARGPNRVVVAAGELIDPRHAHPRVIRLSSRDLADGTFHVPTDICTEQFPGARSVQIRFVAHA